MAKVDRRQFMAGGAGLSLAASAGIALAAPAEPPARAARPAAAKSPQEIRQALTGPISSISTPFLKTGEIDYPGLRKFIDVSIEGGSKTILLTAGDSHYICMSDDEIAEVTKVACSHTAGRAMVVAADRYYSTARAIAFATFARAQGADVYMSLPPDWGGSGTSETLADHYVELAEHTPLMIVTGPFISRGSDFGLKTIELALAKSKNVVAVKDDFCGEFARRLCLKFHDRCALFAGGMKENHMNMYPYGVDGYMSTFISIAPAVANRYWKAIERKDLATAVKIIKEIDNPLFEYVGKLPGGFDAGMHGVRELYGVGTRWRRKPYYSLSDAEMEGLRAFLATLDIPRPT